MIYLIKESLLSNKTLKLTSLIIGYSVWSLLSNYRVTQKWVNIPVCFYNVSENISIKTPEYLEVQLEGKRNELKLLNKNELTFHIDASELPSGKQVLEFRSDQLFLPNSIKMVHYYPRNFIIELEKKI